MKKTHHIVKTIEKNSLAYLAGIEPGDELLTINGEEIEDIFDYQFLAQDEEVRLVMKRPGQDEAVELVIEKDDPYEDIGIEFENGLMDEYRSCHNKCIFCFIDQMPKGMRETLYFKDDDSRLSFLQGNYVTLTNMSEHDIERIIKYHLEPINVSFQTMNPELRCKMLNNRFAGDALKKVDRLYEAGISMNGQIVLCKGVNDQDELDFSIEKMTHYYPHLESVSVVPVGLSKYREGLYPLEPFNKEDARETLAIIHKWQDYMMEHHGTHFIHASDEWYLLAEMPLPDEDNYDGYLQLENGVGMLTLLRDEFAEALELAKANYVQQQKTSAIMKKLQKVFRKDHSDTLVVDDRPRHKTLVTGRLAYSTIQDLANQMMEAFPFLQLDVVAIRNDFFGELITVSGLLTGQDIMAQLKGRDLGECILLPQNVLRSGENYFLDDITVPEVEETLQVKVDIVKSDGRDFVSSIVCV